MYVSRRQRINPSGGRIPTWPVKGHRRTTPDVPHAEGGPASAGACPQGIVPPFLVKPVSSVVSLIKLPYSGKQEQMN